MPRRGQKLFVVRRQEVYEQEVEVRACDENEARDKAARGGNRIGEPEFVRVVTRDIEDWEVFSVKIVTRRP